MSHNELSNLIATLETALKQAYALRDTQEHGSQIQTSHEPVKGWFDLFLEDKGNLNFWYACRQDAKVHTAEAMANAERKIEDWAKSAGVPVSEAEIAEKLMDTLV